MPDLVEQTHRFEELARTALREITPDATVGSWAGETDEGDGVTSVLFDSAMPGYPGWKWTVSIAQVEGEEPTVLEAELMPAEGALLAPDWVPWSERLAEYKAAQESAGETDIESGDDADDDSDDDDDDEDEDDVLGNEVLHGGDLDGVDIDDIDSDIQIEIEDDDPADGDELDDDDDDDDDDEDEDDLDDEDPADDDDLDENGEPDEGYIR